MMAGRVTILLLMSGLFAAMWSGDQSHAGAQKETTVAGRRVSPADWRPRTKIVEARAVRLVSRLREERSLSSIPLPARIAEGTYLVVDVHGRSEVRVVSAMDATLSGHGKGQPIANQLTYSHGADRWHFIRLEVGSSPVARRAAKGPALQHRATPNPLQLATPANEKVQR